MKKTKKTPGEPLPLPRGRRRLLTGEVIRELPDAIPLTIQTKAPDKWIMVDTETGQCWRYDTEHTWRSEGECVAIQDLLGRPNGNLAIVRTRLPLRSR